MRVQAMRLLAAFPNGSGNDHERSCHGCVRADSLMPKALDDFEFDQHAEVKYVDHAEP